MLDDYFVKLYAGVLSILIQLRMNPELMTFVATPQDWQTPTLVICQMAVFALTLSLMLVGYSLWIIDKYNE
jgi:hypothetical protein